MSTLYNFSAKEMQVTELLTEICVRLEMFSGSFSKGLRGKILKLGLVNGHEYSGLSHLYIFQVCDSNRIKKLVYFRRLLDS